MIFKIQLFFFALFFTLHTQTNAAVVVERLDTHNKIATIKIVEKIQYGEEEILERELDELSSEGYKLKLNAIQLNTRGGNAYASLQMGRLIRAKKLNTYVAKGSYCGSACVYVVAGGLVRMVYGRLTVHRKSFDERMYLESVEKFLKKGDEETISYFREMGISDLLSDAIIMTPNWATRELTSTELQRWGIHATDRIYEEMWFRNTATETNNSLDNIRDIFDDNVISCVEMPVRFQMTMWECVASRIPK